MLPTITYGAKIGLGGAGGGKGGFWVNLIGRLLTQDTYDNSCQSALFNCPAIHCWLNLENIPWNHMHTS